MWKRKIGIDSDIRHKDRQKMESRTNDREGKVRMADKFQKKRRKKKRGKTGAEE